MIRQRMRREAFDRLREKILDAVAEYDKSGDRTHNHSPMPGDCVRCNALVAVGYPPSWKDADRQIQREHAARVHARRNAR
jgi:hypothetical protein